ELPAPPTVTITAPAADTRFAAPATIPITATASADTTRVEFFHDGILLGADATVPFTYEWRGVPTQGSAYHVQAVAYNAAGVKSAVADVPVFVDSAPVPVAVIAEPSALTLGPGEKATFGVSLSKAPLSSTAVAISRTQGATAVAATPSQLTFTRPNFAVPQQVTVTVDKDAKPGSTVTFTMTGPGLMAASVLVTIKADVPPVESRFATLYRTIKDPKNGYFNSDGVPYHSIETLIADKTDHGHETTSEAFSYWLWLEAAYGQMSEDWAPFNKAWATMEKYIIPSHADQPTNSFYNPASPVTYTPEHPQPSGYPTRFDPAVGVGSDPIAAELKAAYGTSDIYGMHRLLDVDNVYGFGRCGDGTTKPAYIDTVQRGPQESTWETVPHPACDTFKHGGPNGFLDLYTKGNQSRQWRYTAAPDADARAVQAAYWAYTWAKEQGREAEVSDAVANAAKLGDYLRYSFFDKNFKKIGCASPFCTPGVGKDSADYLLSSSYTWGGATNVDVGFAYRFGSSNDHVGSQNPMTAYALSNVPAFAPKSATGKTDWTTSLGRQLEFYQWLQSAEGAIAGGATNSANDVYDAPLPGAPSFYGLTYVAHPGAGDPPANQSFVYQVWSMERVAELFYVTGDARAKTILDKWVTWAMANTSVTDTGYEIPSTLEWSGGPARWNPQAPLPNTNLHVKVKDYTNDVGVAGSYAKLLTYYAAKSGDATAKLLAKRLLDGIWAQWDGKGVSVTETRADYQRFTETYDAATGQGLYIPSSWSGTMPNGDVIKPGVSFLDIRSFHRKDPDFPEVQKYLDGGPAPTFNYHRFWAQADVATALAEYQRLFPNG
ncbi:MAG TPA: glycoside hydrolase family 48 protein, partial [Actinoplanes sp.]|nr:glycoside hydrolase family 48 protein [Actinoplanes sp.]